MLRIARIERNTLQDLMFIAIPMVVSQGTFALMLFVDRYFMSLISPTHMAASLGGGVSAFFCLSFFIGVLSYATALVAQYYGGGQRAKCPRVLTQSYLLCLLFFPLLLLLAYFFGNIFLVMGHAQEQIALEKRYFELLIYGSGISLVKVCMASYFSGIGKTKIVMLADVMAVIINIPLSYVLVFGKLGLPAMGIEGAAIGTITSILMGLVILIFFYFKREHRELYKVMDAFVYDKVILARYLRYGLPSGFEMCMNVAAFNLFLLMFQSYGIPEAASAAIVFNWDMLAYVPMLGLSVGLTSLVGRFVGAGNVEKINAVVVSGFFLALLYSGTLAVLFVLFRDSFVMLFIRDALNHEDIFALATYMMLGLATYTMADALILVAGGVLRGAGDTYWLMKTSVSLHWLMLLAQYVAIEHFGAGPRVSWLVFLTMIMVIAMVYLYRLKGGRWRRTKALSQHSVLS